MESPKLVHRLLHAVLDSAFVRQHPVEHPVIGPVPRGEPAQQQMIGGSCRIIRGYSVRLAIEFPEILGPPTYKLIQAEIVDGLVLHALGALKPPYEIDQPLGNDRLHFADRVPLGQ